MGSKFKVSFTILAILGLVFPAFPFGYTVGTIDLGLNSPTDNFAPSEIALSMKPGDSVYREVKTLNIGTNPFILSLKVEKISGDDDFCNTLLIKVEAPGIETVELGPIAGSPEFNPIITSFLPLNPGDERKWLFTVTLPKEVSNSLQNKTCQFKFIFTAHQPEEFTSTTSTENTLNILSPNIALAYFSDVEITTNTIKSGKWVLGYAIIVAGQGGWKEKWALDHAANNAYRTLRNLGLKDDYIIYLNSNRPQDIDGDGDDEVDAPALLSYFEKSINEIKDKIRDNSIPFILYLTGHGVSKVFVFDENDLTEGYLQDYQLQQMLNKFASEIRLLDVIGSCYSGSFITSSQGISALNRIIITAAHDDQSTSKSILGLGGWTHSSDRFWGNLNEGLSVRDAYIQGAWPTEWWHLWLDDNGDKIGHPPNNLGDDGDLAAITQIGIPGNENLKLTPWIAIGFRSAGELRIYDSQNRVTGLVNGEIREEIPNSVYDSENKVVAIFSPTDTFSYEIVGTEEGTYGLDIGFIDGGTTIAFTADNIPIIPESIHQYTIDWDTLSQNEKCVTLRIDADNDGIFEQTISSDNELTHDEFMLQTATFIDFDPNTLNLKSKGVVVTVYIELPESYNITQIDVSSIRLNGTIPALSRPLNIDDYDGDGMPDLMVKFDRTLVVSLFMGDNFSENPIIEVTGIVAGLHFKGTDKIKIILL